MKKRRKIALIIESSRGYGRDLLLGISNFAQSHDNWEIVYQERTLSQGIPTWIDDIELDGLIVRPDSKKLYQYVSSLGLPWVDLRNHRPVNPSVPTVAADESLVVKTAVEHLLEIGHRKLAFCGFANFDFSHRRVELFKRYAEAKGVRCYTYETSPSVPADPTESKIGIAGPEITASVEAYGIQAEPELIRWLVELPKPIGLFACNDVRGRQILNILRTQRIAVPEEVSVVGVDNDELICKLSNPPMSSVNCNARMIGYRAAEILQDLIDGKALEKNHDSIRPIGIEVRVSTDTTAIADKLISQALSFIRENACDGIEVSDVVNSLPVSRATLERRFRKVMDRSINSEINRVKIAKIKQLLLETELKLSAVAKLTGFNHTEYMSSLFKKLTGITPGQYRQNNSWK
ncbi:MAG: DNA-binding transcriptional regulator [Planctomycetota bacterium]